MAVAKKVIGYLRSHAIEYDLVEHEPTATASESAAASRLRRDQIAKAVLVKGEDGYFLAVVPASHRIRLGELGSCMEEAVDLATEEEASRIFSDCSRGAIPPLGDPYGIDVIVDHSLEIPHDVYFEGGDHRTLVHVTDDQFAELMQSALHGSFSTPS